MSTLVEIENEMNKFVSSITAHNETMKKSMNKTEKCLLSCNYLNKNELKERLGILEDITSEIRSIVNQQGDDIKSFIPITQKYLKFSKNLQREVKEMGKEMEIMRNEIDKTKILSEYRDWIRDYVKIVKREVEFKNEELDNMVDYWEQEQEDEEQEDEEQEDEEQEDEEDERDEGQGDKRQEDEKEKNDVTTKFKKLEEILENDSLTLSEFVKLFRVQEESNSTFHRDVKHPRKAKDKLKDDNFPKDLGQIKESLVKILDAILIRNKQRKKIIKQITKKTTKRKKKQAKSQIY